MDFLKFAAKMASDDHKTPAHPAHHEDADEEEYQQHAEEAVPANVCMFSGCQDSQTSADVHDVSQFGLPAQCGPAGAGGACTNALLSVLHNDDDGSISYIQLLDSMRKVLKGKGYSQVPQLSSSRKLDLSHEFAIAPNNGRKKALMIGINYIGQKGELRGCINDVESMKNFISRHGFSDIRVLADDPRASSRMPTHDNILESIHWLVSNAQAGDNLFLHYSGHGGQLKDQDGDEEDGYDETLIPVDYRTKGQIRDDLIYKALIAPLPAGVHLTCVMDCCHSGTVLDLPFIIKGTESNMNVFESGGMPFMSANPNFNLQKIIKIASSCFDTYKRSGGDLKAVAMTGAMGIIGEAMGGGGSGGGGGGLAALGGMKFW